MTTPAEQLAVFLAEIKDHPEEDTPRLVLADWLQDQGDPRGELMAIQIRRSHLPEESPESQALLLRERQVLAKHVFDWLGPLVDVAMHWRFSRGLIMLAARAEPLLNLVAKGELHWFQFVEGLSLHMIHREHIAQLMQSPLFSPRTMITILHLDHNRLGDQGLTALFDFSGLKSLRVLSLRATNIRDGTARRIARCPYLENLSVLDLARNRITDEGAEALAASPSLRSLKSLDMRGNRLNLPGLAHLRNWLGDAAQVGTFRATDID